jgi:hypothetical protein
VPTIQLLAFEINLWTHGNQLSSLALSDAIDELSKEMGVIEDTADEIKTKYDGMYGDRKEGKIPISWQLSLRSQNDRPSRVSQKMDQVAQHP